MEFDILIPTEKDGYHYVTLVVDPDEYCAAILDEYKATKLVDGLPSYLEPVFINGEEIRLWDDNITFYDYDIQEGETLHAVLRVRDIHVFIHNVCDNETATVDTLMSTTVSNLKMIARKDERLSASRFLPRELVLKQGDITLNEMSRLSDTTIQDNYTELNLDLQPYRISVLVPTYVGMENVVAQPDDTIASIVKKIMSIQEFKYSISTKKKKMIVRSVVRNTNGTFTYMYFDLIGGGRMQIFMDESSGLETKRYSFVVEKTNTVDDIYDRIELHQDLVVDESTLSDWPKCHLFDGTWTRTFAPQIEAAAPSLLDRGSLTLFFFPQRLKIVSMGRVSPYCTVAEIKATVCQAEGIKAKTRAVMHSFSENYLKEQRQLYNYHPIFNYEYCLTLMRPPGRRVILTDHIKVYVQWPSRPIDPVAVLVEPDDTVIYLKYIIEDELNVPMFMQKLHYAGNLMLMDNRPLASYGIRDGSVVQLRPVAGDEFFSPYAPDDEEFYDRRHLGSNFATIMSTKL